MTSNARRDEIVLMYNELYDKRKLLQMNYYRDKSPKSLTEIQDTSNKLGELAKEYLEELPNLIISRCPYTGELLKTKVDVYGINGPWWYNTDSVRQEIMGHKSFYAIDGGMKMTNTDIKTNTSVFIGPDKPFVIPELLNRHEIKAVITSLEVGGNTTWLVTYFAFPKVYNLDRVNSYPTDRYFVVTRENQHLYYESNYGESDYDFDLTKWLKNGKLMWIDPNDEDYKLKTTMINCPFLNVEGQGRVQVFSKNKLTYLYGNDKKNQENQGNQEDSNQLMADIKRMREAKASE